VTLSACGQNKLDNIQSGSIEFTARYGEQALDCEMRFEHADAQWQLNSLAFFISTPQLQVNDDQWHDIEFTASQWQNSQSSLIWFANDCQQNTPYHVSSPIVADQGLLVKATKLRFTLGLPFEVNHLNPLTQQAPLNIPEMFWSWRNGHKFMRIDAQSSDDAWSFHLGSVDCKSESSLRAPKQECAMPNRVNVEIDWHAGATVALDLLPLLENIALSQTQSCMFTLNDIDNCQVLLENLRSKIVFSAVEIASTPKTGKVDQ
jgi:uncharacterized repeat protein (TIGR04052 family)